MSKDIRSFFSVTSKKTSGINKTPEVKTKKPRLVITDSDDEDVVETTPVKSISTTVKNKRKVVISSDSEDDFKDKSNRSKKSPKHNKLKSENTSKLKPINIDDVFGNTHITQSKVKSPQKKEHQKILELQNKHKNKKKEKGKPKTEIGIHGDDNFEKTLIELDDDDDILLENVDMLDKTIEEAMHSHKEEKRASSIEDTPKKIEKKRQRRNSAEGTETKKPKLDHTDSGIDPDQEAFEKRRYSAMLYQKYKSRGGPKHHGQKELPQGKSDSLKSLTFLRTGVLDSLEGDEFENLVKEHGGRVVHAVSKKVNYIVVGDVPGPAKLDKARGLNIPEINEDDFLDMILVKSGMKPKYNKNMSAASSESGIATEEETSPKSLSKDKHVTKKDKFSNLVDEKLSKVERKSAEEKKSPKSSHHKPNLKRLHDINKSVKSQDIKKEKAGRPKSPSHEIEHKRSKITKSEDLPQISRPKVETSPEMMSWTEKYKPTDIKSIIGQQDGSSNMNKLKKWLQNWYRNQRPEVHKNIPKPSPWAKNDDGAYFKAALLSGPPGVGKTTTATLIAKELGLDVVEFNASDTRSKRLLHEEVSQLLSTNTIAGFASGKKTTDKNRVLLMDEVDGMAGNEDRGGIQELINLIKSSSIPIICMCNDRNHQKMRSLVNYCFDLKFNKPRLEQIKGAMMSICFKEGLNISPSALAEIVNGTGCDIRQTLNHLSMWSAANKNLSLETAQKESKAAKKDTILGPWEVVRAVFTESEQKTMSLADKSRLFFYDYSLGPLFVQENYLNVTPNCNRKEVMKRVSLAADAISMGDIIDSKIRGSNNWSLLESQAMYSSVLPGFYMSGNITKRINFPGWLGKNSSANKFKRMLNELHMHTRTSTSGCKLALKLDYLVPLRNAIIYPLKKYETDGAHQAVQVMKAYNLLREDFQNLIELTSWKDAKNPYNDISAKVKSAFTRVYNKEANLLPFSSNTGVLKKRAAALDSTSLEDEELAESDTEETNEDVTADSMIKVKTKTDSKTKKESSKAGTSKPKDTSSKPRKGTGKKLK